jgi:hypothetical protein
VRLHIGLWPRGLGSSRGAPFDELAPAAQAGGAAPPARDREPGPPAGTPSPTTSPARAASTMAVLGAWPISAHKDLSPAVIHGCRRDIHRSLDITRRSSVRRPPHHPDEQYAARPVALALRRSDSASVAASSVIGASNPDRVLTSASSLRASMPAWPHMGVTAEVRPARVGVGQDNDPASPARPGSNARARTARASADRTCSPGS